MKYRSYYQVQYLLGYDLSINHSRIHCLNVTKAFYRNKQKSVAYKRLKSINRLTYYVRDDWAVHINWIRNVHWITIIVMTAYEEDTQCAETENQAYIAKIPWKCLWEINRNYTKLSKMLKCQTFDALLFHFFKIIVSAIRKAKYWMLLDHILTTFCVF